MTAAGNIIYPKKAEQFLVKTSTMKTKLINEIWEYVKHTHNNKDFEDLKTFNVNELKEILTDCKNN